MSEIRAATISNAAGTGPTDLTGQWASKSWINWNGTGTVAIQQSNNVASLTDGGTGDYYVNFANVMSATGYATPASHNNGGAGAISRILAQLTANFRSFNNVTAGAVDVDTLTVAVMGELA